jgi:hypothetical protein
MLNPKFSGWRGTDMEEEEKVSNLDDPLDELESLVENGEAGVYIDDGLPWGEQSLVDFGTGITVSPEEHDMKRALLEYDEALNEMVGVAEEEWPNVLDRHGVKDKDRRNQLQLFALDASE